MKNMIKAMMCAMMLTAAVVALPAVVSARDNQKVYVCDSYTLNVYDQADEYSDLVCSISDAYGYEMYVQDFLNGFGYCYLPDFEVNGWVDLAGVSYVAEKDDYDVHYDKRI